MYDLTPFQIDLKGLKESATALEYDLTDAYFEAIGATEVSGGSVHTEVMIRPCAGFFEMIVRSEGHVRVTCDRCLDDMEQAVSAENRVIVRFGVETAETDDVLMVDESEGVLDVAWLIYEFIALAIPVRHVHAPGECNEAMMQALEAHSAQKGDDEQAEKEIDSRWSALLKLKE